MTTIGNEIDYYKSRGDVDLSAVPNRRQQRNAAAKLAVAKKRAEKMRQEEQQKGGGGSSSSIRTSSTSSASGRSRELSPVPRKAMPRRAASSSHSPIRSGSSRRLEMHKEESSRSIERSSSTRSMGSTKSKRPTKPPKGSNFGSRPIEGNTTDGIFVEKTKDPNAAARPKLKIQLSFRKNKSSSLNASSAICNAA